MKIRNFNSYSKWFIIIGIPLLFNSCKKFLDEKSDKSLVVLKSIDDLQGILDDYYLMNSNTPGFGEASSDDYFLPKDMYNSLDQNPQKEYKWQLTDYTFPNDWADNYGPVFNANYCLEQIDKVEMTAQNQNDWKNVKGSAYYFRAYYFLNLIWEYGKAYDSSTAATDLGIALRLNSDFNIPTKRASVQDSYLQVIKDLMEAGKYLPDISIHPMRPSRVAALAALARTYLTMRNYDSAYKYSDLALQLKNDLVNYNSNEVDLLSDIPFHPFNKEIIFYSTQSFNHYVQNPYYAAIDTSLYASYNSNDLRKVAYFIPNNNYYSFKGSYASDPYTFYTGISTDEMYLTRAECSARKGLLSDALNDLNTLLQNRWLTGSYVPANTNVQQDLINIILNERRKELLMRGLRWIDIKRLNKEGKAITPKRVIDGQEFLLAPNDSKYALPLPRDIIEYTGISQN